MGSPSPVEESLRTRLHRQAVVATLGERAAGADDFADDPGGWSR